MEGEEKYVGWVRSMSRIGLLDLWEQVDGVVYLDGLSCLVECKHWQEPVGFGPIAKLKVRVERRPPPSSVCSSV